MSKLSEVNKYESLFQSFEGHNNFEHSSIESRCKSGLAKLKLVREFAEIDQYLLDRTLEVKACSSEFFSDILYFEAKRLAFKEEAIKCQQTADQTQKQVRINI